MNATSPPLEVKVVNKIYLLSPRGNLSLAQELHAAARYTQYKYIISICTDKIHKYTMFTLKAFPILKIIDHNDRWSVKWQSKLNNKKRNK